MSSVKKGLDWLSGLLDKACGVLIVAMLGVMVLTTTAQIICRVFFTALSWSEELTRYLLIWSTFLGATCVYKHGGNIAITMLRDHLPPKVGKVVKLAAELVCCALFVVVTIYGFQYFAKQGGQLSAALRVPMKYIYICIPVSMVILVLHSVDAIVSLLVPAQKEVEA